MRIEIPAWYTNYKKEIKERVLMHRHWLHQHPELAFEEKETTAYIAKHLQAVDILVHPIGECGLFADLVVDKSFSTIAIRAEMDALPVKEETGLPFASVCDGKMHACGHDANTAIVLTLAEFIAKEKEHLKCNLRFIFEPAEEIGEGAKYMIAHGALKNPEPKEILLFHFGNEESNMIEVKKSISTAQIAGLQITVQGRSSHFCQYNDGVDAMYAAAKFVCAVHNINENFTAQYPFVLGFGLMQVGTGGNIVADRAELKGSLRTFTKEDFELIYQEMLKRCKEIELETGASIQVEITKIVPPIINDAQMVKRVSEVGAYLRGEQFRLVENPFLAGDNAAYYLEHVPGLHVVFLAKKKGETTYPIHNSRFDLDEEEIVKAVEFLLTYISSFAEK